MKIRRQGYDPKALSAFAVTRGPHTAPALYMRSVAYIAPCASAESSSSATMLVILIIGFTAGPAVSL